LQQLTLPFLPRAVLLFGRAPDVESEVKPLGNRGLDIHRAMLHATLTAIRGLDREVDLLLPGDQEDGLLQQVIPVLGSSRKIRSVPIFGDGFGPRLTGAIAGIRALGYASLVVVPGDVAELRLRHLHRALGLLGDGIPAVLGPARDGGVYLLGLSISASEVLRRVPWRSPGVRLAIEHNLRARGHEWVCLDPLSDVDHPRALLELNRRLQRRQPDHELARLLAQAASGEQSDHISIGGKKPDRRGP
jgi:glycosyltransferase A (GT-A) superfamily protein (DUF2064 family)